MKGWDITHIIMAIMAIILLILAGISLFIQNGDETTVVANNPPIAEINVVDTTVEEMETVHFNGSGSTDTDGTIIEYIWDFDDGSGASGEITEHFYQTEGSYNVTLTVIDDDGASDIAILTIIVDPMTTPTGAFYFQVDTTTQGKYIGQLVSLSSEVTLENASLTIFDASTGGSASQGPPIVSEQVIQVTGGMNLTYTDTNSNSKLDAGDVWVIQGGASNDEVRLIFKTGAPIATYKLQ